MIHPVYSLCHRPLIERQDINLQKSPNQSLQNILPHRYPNSYDTLANLEYHLISSFEAFLYSVLPLSYPDHRDKMDNFHNEKTAITPLA